MDGLSGEFAFVGDLCLVGHIFARVNLPASTSHTLRLRPVAKINLGLEVLRRRADGYHDINSIFVAIDLHDELEIAPSDSIEFTCEPNVTADVESNLVVRAARALLDPISRGAKIRLRKHIPTGAGLGGGSSDAAATLVGLRKLYDLTVSDNDLAAIAAGLGSDVPFFLSHGQALIGGRGDIVQPVTIDVPWTFGLVIPDIHVNTAAAYSTLGITGEQHGNNLVDIIRRGVDNQEVMRSSLINDFERSVFTQHPVLQAIKTHLLDAGATYAAMSGSGSTIFGLFTSVESATIALRPLSKHRTYICHAVSTSFVFP